MNTQVSSYPSLADMFFDESIRIETLIWLAACGHDQPSDALKEFLESQEPDYISGVCGVTYDEDTAPDEYTAKLARAHKMGFLVQAATPIPVKFHDDGGISSHGFGYCQTAWFYTEAVDEAFAQRLLDWKASVIAKTKEKLAKESARSTSRH